MAHRDFCQVCGSKNKLNIHHKRYIDKFGNNILFNERIEDLVTLCSSCHSLWHRHIKEIRKPNKKILRIKRLMEFGVKKNKAFWIVSNPDLYNAIRSNLSDQGVIHPLH